MLVRDNDSHLSNYIYNAGGERVWKLTGAIERMSVNGKDFIDQANMNKTLYTSPYMVITEKEYTKHYFIGSERITSKIGGGFAPRISAIIDDHIKPVNQEINIAGDLFENMIFSKEHPIASCSEGIQIDFDRKFNFIYDIIDNNKYEAEQYFYHSDHLGSSSWITDASGSANQHLQYLSFGELLVDERKTGQDARFKFTGKERDAETGFDYFGARYYESDLSIWLSVDPLAMKFPNQSPYSYVGNRPISVIDPDGRDEIEISKTNGKITKLNSNQYYQDGKNIITVKEGEEYSGDKDLTKLKKVDKLNNSEGQSKYFTAGTISASKNKKLQIFAFQNQSEAESFYNFAAESSNVEWAFGKVKSEYAGGATGYVGSNFSAGMTTIPGMLEEAYGKNVSFISHSHPNVTGTAGLPSFDMRRDGKRVGDLNNAAVSPHQKIIREVYVPLDGVRYRYNNKTLGEARLLGTSESRYIGQPIRK